MPGTLLEFVSLVLYFKTNYNTLKIIVIFSATETIVSDLSKIVYSCFKCMANGQRHLIRFHINLLLTVAYFRNLKRGVPGVYIFT